MALFRDRRTAGRELAPLVRPAVTAGNVVVLGLPRGGVPVAYEIAALLNAPLDVLVVRKLGMPGEEELALGAIASGGIQVLNRDLIMLEGVTRQTLEAVTRRETIELERRESLFRQGRPPVDVQNHTVVVADDGLATGATMLAACRSLRARNAAQIVVAVPVAARQSVDLLKKEHAADNVIAAATPGELHSVGRWYEDFAATSDDEVRLLLNEAASERTKIRSNASNVWGARE